MKKTHTVRAFLAGVLVTLLAVSTITSTMAASASKNITIFPGISIFIDEKKLEPKDAKGNTVEVFTSNGTTYLPVRAICEALGQPVEWDGNTRSVYIGKHVTSTNFASYLDETDYFYQNEGFSFKDYSSKDNLGNTHNHCIPHSFDRTYKLNGQYSHFTCTIFLPELSRDLVTPSPIQSGIQIYGDDQLLLDYAPEQGVHGFQPVDFNVPLNGVTELRVVFRYRTLLLGDAILWK